jgi:hypothetical protein
LNDPCSPFFSIFPSRRPRFFSMNVFGLFQGLRNSCHFHFSHASGTAFFAMHSKVIKDWNHKTQGQYAQIEDRQDGASSMIFAIILLQETKEKDGSISIF